MTENEELFNLVKQTLLYARQVRAELEKDLADIKNPNIVTDAKKKQVVNRMRLITGLIDVGEAAQKSLSRKIAQENNRQVRKRKK